MVREMKEAGLHPYRPVLSYKSKDERLGKLTKENQADEDVNLPPHLLQRLRRTPKVRSVIVVPSLDETGASPSNVQHNSGAGPPNWQDNLVGHSGPESSTLCDDTSDVTTL